MLHQGAIKYQLSTWKKPLLIYYLVIVCIYLLVLLEIPFVLNIGVGNEVSASSSSISGMDLSSIIFLFVCGICSFREEFRFLNQNGCSRKTALISWLASVGVVAVAMAIIDTLLVAAATVLGNLMSVTVLSGFQLLFSGSPSFSSNEFLQYFQGMGFNFCAYTAALCLGYFISIAYYRMSKGWKIAVSIGIPGFFSILLPIIDAFTGGIISALFYHLFAFAFASAGSTVIFCLLTAAVLTALCWLLTRRAPVRAAQS